MFGLGRFCVHWKAPVNSMAKEEMTPQETLEFVRSVFPNARLMEEVFEPHLIPMESSSGRRYLIDSETRKVVKVLEEG